MSANRVKQLTAKQMRKSAYGIKENRTEKEKQQLNPRVPYQRRKAARLRGEPLKARPPSTPRFVSVPDGAQGVKVYSPGFTSWLQAFQNRVSK